MGIALFLEVTIVLLVPIIFSIAKELKVSIVHLGLPMVTAALATHAFLPPHPGPTAVAAEYGANIGLVLIYGIIVAIPTVILAGILYPKLAKKLSRLRGLEKAVSLLVFKNIQNRRNTWFWYKCIYSIISSYVNGFRCRG